MCTYDRTLLNSLDGLMTKLSFVLDHEMRCWMLWSSSMLWAHQLLQVSSLRGSALLVQLVDEGCLNDLGTV